MTDKGKPGGKVRQDSLAWQQGFDDARAGKPARCRRGLDRLSYESGYAEGKARDREPGR
jgi:hypothetical protein